MTTAISPSRVASVVGIKNTFRNLATSGFGLSQRIAVIAHGSTASTFTQDKLQVFSAQEAGTTYGFGSQIHEIVERLLPASGNGVGGIPVTVFPLADGTTPSVGTITPSGVTTAAGTYFVTINNLNTLSFELASGAAVADATLAITDAVNALLRLPMTCVDGATVATLTCKWGGLTGDDLVVSITGPSVGMTFVVVQPTAGAGNPVIDSTITDQFGEVWYTIVVNGLGDDAPALTALAAFNEGRWTPEVTKFFGAFYASTESVFATAIAVPDSRASDRTNIQLSEPGSNDMPWAAAARMVVEIAKIAHGASPATDYLRTIASGLVPGADSLQWNSSQRDTAVKAGTSTSEIRDGEVTLGDTVTMYHPLGDPTPAYRYFVDIVKLMQINNDIRSTFDSVQWVGKPLVPDGQVTTNPDAKSPKMARAAFAGLIDGWALDALISDPEAAKESILAAIDGGNPKRLNVSGTVQLVGNANVISIDLDHGFFFGS